MESARLAEAAARERIYQQAAPLIAQLPSAIVKNGRTPYSLGWRRSGWRATTLVTGWRLRNGHSSRLWWVDASLEFRCGDQRQAYSGERAQDLLITNERTVTPIEVARDYFGKKLQPRYGGLYMQKPISLDFWQWISLEDVLIELATSNYEGF